VVSFTSRALYPRGKNHRYPFGGPQSQSGQNGSDVKNILALAGKRTTVVQYVA